MKTRLFPILDRHPEFDVLAFINGDIELPIALAHDLFSRYEGADGHRPKAIKFISDNLAEELSELIRSAGLI